MGWIRGSKERNKEGMRDRSEGRWRGERESERAVKVGRREAGREEGSREEGITHDSTAQHSAAQYITLTSKLNDLSGWNSMSKHGCS